MMAKRDPARTAATRKRIEDAFWSLYCDVEFESITASAVAKAAGVNRSTFYAHFHDVREVLESIESDLMLYMGKMATAVAGIDDPAEAAKIARAIFDERGEQLCVFLGRRRSERVLESARAMLGGIVARKMLGIEGKLVGSARYRAEFVATGLIGAYVRWLEDGRPVPIEEVASVLKASALAAAEAEQLLADRPPAENGPQPKPKSSEA